MDLNRLRGSSKNEPGKPGVDYELSGYTIRWQPHDADSGWREVEGYLDEDDPIDRETFQWNNPNLEPGLYRQFAKDERGRLRRPPNGERWSFEIEADDESSSSSADQEVIEHIAQTQEALLARLDEGSGGIPDDPEKALKLLTLHNEDFMMAYGEDIARAAWGINPNGDGLGFSDFNENKLGAILYDAYSNPEKLRQIGENLGAGVGSGLDGFWSGIGEDGEVDERDVQDDGDEAEDDGPRTRESRAAAITLDDLDAPSPDEEELREAAVSDGPDRDVDVDRDADQEEVDDAGVEDEAEQRDEGEPEPEPEVPDDLDAELEEIAEEL